MSRTARATLVAAENAALIAAQNPKKLAKAKRVVVAGVVTRTLTLAEIVAEIVEAAPEPSESLRADLAALLGGE